MARRIYCRGNCGRFFYYDGSKKPGKLRGGGRPPEWCPRCYRIHKNERTQALREFYRANGMAGQPAKGAA